MSEFLFDTNHASALWQGNPTLQIRLAAQRNASFGLCLPSLGELWFMVFNSKRIAENEQKLALFVAGFHHWPFDERPAMEFGRIRAELRRAGKPIPSVDAQIAAIARTHDFVLLTADAHFNYVPNLKTENWLQP